MKKVFLILCLVFLCSLIFAQDKKSKEEKATDIVAKSKTLQERIDSLKAELDFAKEDTNKVNILQAISFYYQRVNPDEGIKFGEEGLILSQKIKWLKGEAKCYNSLGVVSSYGKSDYPKALEYFIKSLKIHEELNNKSGIANNLQYIGYIYRSQSDYPNALAYYHRALKTTEELNNKSGIANNLVNIGIIYMIQSNYPKALEYYLKALKINEEIVNKSGIAHNLMNIGNIYMTQSNYPKALEYFHKALKINDELGDKMGIANNLGNIGIIYLNQSDIPKALEYHFKALKIHEELRNKLSIAHTLSDIGYAYKESDFPKALEYQYKALKIHEELGNKLGIALDLGSIGRLYLNQSRDSIIDKSENRLELILNKENNLNKAIEYINKAVEIYIEIGGMHYQSSFLSNLSEAYEIKGDYKEAFETYKKYKVLQDSVFSMDKQKEIANLDAKRENELKDKENEILKQQSYNQTLELDKRNKEVALLSANQQVQKLELEKRNSEMNILQKDKELVEISARAKESEAQNKEKEIKLLQAKEQSQKNQIKQATNQRYVLIGGLLLFAVLIIFIFARFREKKELSEKLAIQKAEIENQKRIVESQKEIVEEQKEILEEKNNHIYASITYASTIQQAILPWESTLKKAFSDILVFYKPKDIVSGDAYWFQEIEGIRFLAVIDCTGHGIPGAMLTVIASDVLDDAVLGKRLTDTGKILTYMNEKVTEVLNQKLAENKIRDGMEVALIAIHPDKIQFSGAGRPLYLKNGTIEIVKADKRGIAGQTENDEYQFSSIDIEKTENWTIYLTTDGFADQMNENSKKYSTKRFVALLESISEKQISEQEKILENEFNSHKGTRNQIDDVTILGVRL